MSIMLMRGGEAKGFTTTGGAVSPPLLKKKLSCELVLLTNLFVCYG